MGNQRFYAPGVAIFRSIYNAQGKVTRMTLPGVKKRTRPCIATGNHALGQQYDDRPAIASLRPIWVGWQTDFSGGRLRSMTSSYDVRGRKDAQSYHGVNGEPLLHKDGNHAGNRYTTNAATTVATTFIRIDGKPVVITNGYAIVRQKIRLGWERA